MLSEDRLRDTQDAIAAIRRHLERAGETTAAKEDSLLHGALLFQFVVIGEAVKHLGAETRESTSEIPRADIAGLRDLIAHEYFRIDIHRLLEIVERDLPPSLGEHNHSRLHLASLGDVNCSLD